MNPISIIEVLYEGLLFFRRILTVKGTFNKVVQVSDLIDTALDRDLRFHKTVYGEEAYLFILGRETIYPLIKGKGMSQSEIDNLILSALAEALLTRTSNDIKSVLVDFAFALGRTLQENIDDFEGLCASYLNDPRGSFVLQDPVLNYINTTSPVPAPTAAILTALGVDNATWGDIVADVRLNGYSIVWLDAHEKIPNEGIRPHKTQTFLGLIRRGALSVVPSDLDEVPITLGTDGMSLSLATLTRPIPFTYIPEKLPDNKSITREMVDSYSRQTMLQRNFVYTADSGWLHVTEAVSVQDPKDKAKTIFVSRKSLSAHDDTHVIKDAAQGLVISTVLSLLTKSAKASLLANKYGAKAARYKTD